MAAGDVFGAIAAVLVAAGWWIASRLTHSLERLTAYAEAVRDGRAAVPPVSKAKEIAAQGRAFEEMRVSPEGKAHVERYPQALAHECKAPLTAIRGAAELLGEDLPREARARFVANLRAESDRLQRIVEGLLELSALEARRAGAAMAVTVDLQEVGADACEGARVAAEAKRVTLTLRCGEARRVRGEKVLLGQAVGNLVQNALAFSAPGAVVTVAIGGKDGGVCVCVEDTGPGGAEFCVGEGFRPLLLATASRLRAEKQRAGVEQRARDCASARRRGDVGEPPVGRGAGGADVADGVGRRVVRGRCFHREFTAASRALHAHGAAWERHAPTPPATPPLLPPAAPTAPTKTDRRNRATLKLLFIAAPVLLLQWPLHWVNGLQQERRETRASGGTAGAAAAVGAGRGASSAAKVGRAVPALPAAPADGAFEAYRLVERALKHSVLVLALVFAAFSLFETLAGLRLHGVHYGLVSAAMGLFYLALLALGEVFKLGAAYVGAVASSWLVTLYSAAILRSWVRAAVIVGLLAGVHGVLFVVLQMEDYALFAGTGALFAALPAAMFFKRPSDWHAQDAGGPEVAT